MTAHTHYHTVVTLEDYQDDHLLGLMDSRDREAIAEYLSGWDCGEYHDESHEVDQLRGYDKSEHDIKYSGKYLLLCHWGLGSASLLVEA